MFPPRRLPAAQQLSNTRIQHPQVFRAAPIVPRVVTMQQQSKQALPPATSPPHYPQIRPVAVPGGRRLALVQGLGLQIQSIQRRAAIGVRPAASVVQRETSLSSVSHNPLVRYHQKGYLYNTDTELYCIVRKGPGWHISIFVINATSEQNDLVLSSEKGKVPLQNIPGWQNLKFNKFHVVIDEAGTQNHHYYNDDGTILWAQKPNEAPLKARSWYEANRIAASFFQDLGIRVDVNQLDVRAEIAKAPEPIVRNVPVNQLPTHMRPRVLQTPKPFAKPPAPMPASPILAPPQPQPPQPLPPQLPQQQLLPPRPPSPPPQRAPMAVGGFGSYPYDRDQHVFAPHELSTHFMETGDW